MTDSPTPVDRKQVFHDWVTALRSGDYEQGRAVLRSRDDKYCCLGVLIDILPGVEWGNVDGAGPYTVLGHNGDPLQSCLPLQIAESLGIGQLGELDGDSDRTLAFHNDNGKTFTEIADVIEAYAESL